MELPALVLCPLTLRRSLYACGAREYGEILDAAVEAGYRGASLAILDVEIAAREGISLDGVLGRFRERGLAVPIVEAVSGWGQGETESEIVAAARPVLEIAVRAGAEVVVALSPEPTIPSIGIAATGFRQLCLLAEQSGLKVALEFFPWGGIGDIRTAWQVVREAGAVAGGICLDVCHWARDPRGRDLDALREIPADRIHVVQIADVAATPESDPMRETLRRRHLPGQGVAGVAELLRVLREAGAEPLLAPEVFNAELFELGTFAMAREVARATRAVLTEAGYGSQQ